jgi:NADH-quinone oxidoreductase subunit L
MLVPLVALALLAIVGGLLNLPLKPLDLLDKWLQPVVGAASNIRHMSTAGKWASTVATTALCLVGIGLGFTTWARSPNHEALEPAPLKRAWYIDPLYAAVIEKPGLVLSDIGAWFIDKDVIDGAVNGIGVLVRGGGSQLRKLQTGYVRNYALGIAAGTVAILGYVVFRAS